MLFPRKEVIDANNVGAVFHGSTTKMWPEESGGLFEVASSASAPREAEPSDLE
jgi:hypothetical protein